MRLRHPRTTRATVDLVDVTRDDGGPHAVTAEPPLLTPRTVTATIATAVAVVLMLAMLLIPAPYAIYSPGPTVDTIGDIDDEPLITIDGARTYPTDGELLLTTVSTRGGPGYPVTTGQVIRGWLSSAATVVPRESAFDPEQDREEISEESTIQMASSQTSASIAALTELDYDVPADLWVAGARDGGPADGVLEAEDQLEWIETETTERTDLTSFQVLSDLLADTPPGTSVTIGIQRAGTDEAVDLVTEDDGAGGSLLGVYISPDADLPVDISFAIENIGGPSGGLMLALAIVDLLTPGALTGGDVIAGTGTIGIDGDVGPIGGIAQKMVGARNGGAEWFLAPEGNCAEAAGRVPDGLQVVSVGTLEDAMAAVASIADGGGGELAACAAP